MSPADTVAAINAAHERLGTIDVLVSSVTSLYRPELLARTPIEQIPEILSQQALPPMYLSRAVLPIMQAQRGGSIINIASDAGKTATPGETVLGGSMAAIIMFSRALAMEAKRDGIRVNAVTPSLINGTPTAGRVTRDRLLQAALREGGRPRPPRCRRARRPGITGRLPRLASLRAADRPGDQRQRRHLRRVRRPRLGGAEGRPAPPTGASRRRST